VDKRMRNGYDPRTAATRKMRVVPVRPRKARPLPLVVLLPSFSVRVDARPRLLRLALPRMRGTSHIAICDVAGKEVGAVWKREMPAVMAK